MLSWIVYILSNVFIVLLLFFFVLLVMLWAIGKQKATQRNMLSSAAARASSAARNPFSSDDPQQPHHHLQQEQQHINPHMNPHSTDSVFNNPDGPYTSRPSVTPSVMPRRLSFSTTTPTVLTRTVNHTNNGFSSMPNAIPQSETPLQGRRVTFSLTPEQQQNEYDKQASANLARRRAPTVVTHPSPLSNTPDPRHIPLVELFPSQAQQEQQLYQSRREAKPTSNFNSLYEHDQYFRQLPHQQVRAQESQPQNPLNNYRSLRTLDHPTQVGIGGDQAWTNPFMPTTHPMYRRAREGGDQLDDDQNSQPRRKPPPLPILS